jgi:methionyl-tRNA formyltransferase
VLPLIGLHDEGYDIALVVSRADARRGRRAEPTPSPVKAAALARGIPVTADVDAVLDVGADLGVVVAFGRIIKPHVLAALPMVNLHFSALPRWRGAAPVERAILAGDTATAVCLMDVEEGLDTGGVRARAVVEIEPDETADALRGRLAAEGMWLLINAFRDGLPASVAQEGEATYAEKVTPAELELDWRRPAAELYRKVRVGGAWTTYNGARVKVERAELAPWDVAPPTSHAVGFGEVVDDVVRTWEGGLRLVEVKPEGRRGMPGRAWRQGLHPGGRPVCLGT